MLQPLLQVGLGERLDQVVHDPAAQRFAHGFHLAGGADHQHVEVRRHLPQPVHEVQPVDVRKVDVQQHQVRLQPFGFDDGLGTGVRDAHHGEARRCAG